MGEGKKKKLGKKGGKACSKEHILERIRERERPSFAQKGKGRGQNTMKERRTSVRRRGREKRKHLVLLHKGFCYPPREQKEGGRSPKSESSKISEKLRRTVCEGGEESVLLPSPRSC